VYKNPNNVRKRGNILEKESESLAAGYRRTFGISKAVDVHFTGVFDTVASIGGLDLQGEWNRRRPRLAWLLTFSSLIHPSSD
jgi:hypothetical protein